MNRDLTDPTITKLDINQAFHKAVIQPNGSYLNQWGTINWFNELGQYHRIDGPAITYSTSRSCWYINGSEYDFNEWLKLTPISDEQKLLLRLQYG
jgi:hypothetical protein